MFQPYRALIALYVIFILNFFDQLFIKWFYVDYQEVLSYKIVGS